MIVALLLLAANASVPAADRRPVGVTPKGDRFDYMVDLVQPGANLSSQRLASMSGTCREEQIARCAADIVAKAERKVKD